MKRQQVATTVALVGTDVAVLIAARPHPHPLLTDLAAPHDWFAREGVDGALTGFAATALWVAAAWLALGLAAAALACLPGVAGRVGSGLAAHLLPRVVRSVLAGSTGIGVLLAPAAAGAGALAGSSVVSACAVAPAEAAPPPAGAAAAARAEHAARAERAFAAAHAAQVPSPAWPTTDAASGSVPAPSWPVERHPDADPDGAATTVRRGDSLWVIAARRLGTDATPAEIAAAWPRWYAANRDVIGDDPGLIVPGQVLQAPATATEETHR